MPSACRSPSRRTRPSRRSSCSCAQTTPSPTSPTTERSAHYSAPPSIGTHSIVNVGVTTLLLFRLQLLSVFNVCTSKAIHLKFSCYCAISLDYCLIFTTTIILIYTTLFCYSCDIQELVHAVGHGRRGAALPLAGEAAAAVLGAHATARLCRLV